MNYRMVFSTVGKVLKTESFLMALPLAVSLIYQEWFSATAFLITAVAVFLIGLILSTFLKPKSQVLFAKEGFITVALSWIFVSLFGAVPFVISGEIPNYVNALFETVSGFTTTGASILTDVTALTKGMLFWRSFTHWIGGMGVLVFILAITSKAPDRSMHVLRAEMPGPIVDKFLPKAKQTTLILYLIYTAMTVILIIMLLAGGMPLFESVVHAFGTAGTGGFGIKPDSIVSYSPYIQWVIAIFMLLFGINFNLYYLIIIGKASGFFKSRELWVYLSVFLSATLLVGINVYELYGSFSETLRVSVFQTSSMMTTTGFATADFANWPALAKTVLLTLMFIGGCAGSTAGGFKVSRIMIIFKKIKQDLKRVLHPRTMTIVKFEGKRLDEETINGVGSYLMIYLVIFFIIFLLLSFDPNIPQAIAIETNFSATASCINNIGPGLAGIGPMANYAIYSPLSKIVLTFAMLLGRLEIYPLLLTLSISTWIKK